MSDEDKKKYREKMDCYCFYALQWSHLFTFVLQVLSFVLKYKEYFNTSQILQGLIIPQFYLGAVLYTTYQVKSQKDEWIYVKH